MRVSGLDRLFFALVFFCVLAPSAGAIETGTDSHQPITQLGRWVAPEDTQQTPPADGPAPSRAGGDYLYHLHLTLHEAQRLVIDFKSSSVIGHFQHRVYDDQDTLIIQFEGGLQQAAPGDYFLRHGKNLNLPAGHYRMETRLSSPFFLATPTPSIYTTEAYRDKLRYSQALTLTGMGIFFALAFYYLVMGLWRRVLTDLLYAGFIIGNLLFNGSAQLVFRDLFGWQWVYLVSAPILFSNLIYIGFVMVLLSINRLDSPRLFKIGIGAMMLLASFWPMALLAPNWSLELARYGVAVFALYGLSAGISQSLARNRVAYFYLIANAAFAIPAFISISLRDMALSDFLLIEQLGMVAVLIEILLLAQVMSYQIGLVYKERAQQQANIEQTELLSNLATQIPGVIYQLRMTPDGSFNTPFASEGLREMFNLIPADIKSDASAIFAQVIPEDYPELLATIKTSAQNMAPWIHEFRVNLPGQGIRWRAGNAQPERQTDGSILWHGFITDATERKLIEQKIQHMAQHDLLTNLPNRALFMDRLEHALERAKREHEKLALMFVDLDNFKAINDQHGHQVGDKLLQQIAWHLTLSLRASDTAARIGGDEFVILLQPVNESSDALTVAQKILQALKSPHRVDDLKLQVSASIGIALYPDHGHSSAVLLHAADAAMYQTKKTGRDNIHVYTKEPH